jgi:hypothetical protein
MGKELAEMASIAEDDVWRFGTARGAGKRKLGKKGGRERPLVTGTWEVFERFCFAMIALDMAWIVVSTAAVVDCLMDSCCETWVSYLLSPFPGG